MAIIFFLLRRHVVDIKVQQVYAGSDAIILGALNSQPFMYVYELDFSFLVTSMDLFTNLVYKCLVTSVWLIKVGLYVKISIMLDFPTQVRSIYISSLTWHQKVMSYVFICDSQKIVLHTVILAAIF